MRSELLAAAGIFKQYASVALVAAATILATAILAASVAHLFKVGKVHVAAARFALG